MARVSWSDAALEHVRMILAKIRGEDPPTAQKWAARIMSAPDILADQPRLGSVVEEFALDHLRELLVGSFRLIYTIREDECVVVAVIRAQRDITRAIDPANLP
jgi:plasmid stabilization system protein ParE